MLLKLQVAGVIAKTMTNARR